MAFGSPTPDHSWSPAGAIPNDAPAERDRPGFGLRAPAEGADGQTLDLGLVHAMIQDGLLMVLGPDGDPVPPQTFGAAAAEQPDAGVRLVDGPRVAAGRIAAALDAQLGGRLGSGERGEAWINAMLGLGPQPGMVEEDALLAESCIVEVIAFGKELMIASPNGATFLLADARSRTPERACLYVANEGPIAIADLIARLQGGAAGHHADDGPPHRHEFAMPGCHAALEDDALILDLPMVGAVQLARADDDDLAGPSVSLFTANGETAAIDDLLRALSRPLSAPTAVGDIGPRHPVMARSEWDAQPPRAVPLSIGLPHPLAAKPDRVALVVVRGLPAEARLSAGVRSGDGSWLISPRNLAGLSLTPPPGWSLDFALEVTAITVANREGELTSVSTTVLVRLRSPAVEPAPAPIPLGLDPDALSDGGSFDAIVVRGMPEGAILSAGTYDPAIAGWVLLPHQLPDLTLTPAKAPSPDFTLSLLGISLRPGDRARPRVLARVPVAIG